MKAGHVMARLDFSMRQSPTTRSALEGGTGMLHSCELQVLRCGCVFRHGLLTVLLQATMVDALVLGFDGS